MALLSYPHPNMSTSRPMKIFVDGAYIPREEVQVDPFSQTLHYGNGIFDGIRAYQTEEGPRMFKAEAHFARFAEAARVMGLPLEYSVEELVEIANEVLRINKLGDAYVRPLLVAGTNMTLTSTPKANLYISAWKWGKLLGDNLVHLMVSSHRRPSSSMVPVESKISGLYVNNILATSEARANGYQEGLMLNAMGEVAQAAGANIFIEKDEVLYTPPRGSIMPGITRETVFEMAEEMGIPVEEKPLLPKDIYEADGAFLAGTAVEITGVATVDRRPLKHFWSETLGHLLSRKYRQLVTQDEASKWTVI